MKQFYLQQILAAIFYMSNKIQTEGDKIDKRLTTRQWMTLLSIIHLPKDKASYNQIANMMGCSKQNAKHIVEILERKELVIISKNKNDNRAVNIEITDHCREILQEYYDHGNEFLNQMFQDFDETELEVLWNLLKKLAASDGSNWIGFEEKVPIILNGKEE